MTQEEMIEQLENTILLIRQNDKDWWDERDIPVLEEAIKAMKMEPCEDCISRQAAIDTAIEAADKWDGGFSVERSRIITEALNELPSVQPEPFINKPCVSEGACHEDKMKVLEKIRAELERRGGNDEKAFCKSLNESYKLGLREAIEIIDKYMVEDEDK